MRTSRILLNTTNKYSKELTQDISHGAGLSMLYSLGIEKKEMNKAQIGIFTNAFDSNPCNKHLFKKSEVTDFLDCGLTKFFLIPNPYRLNRLLDRILNDHFRRKTI